MTEGRDTGNGAAQPSSSPWAGEVPVTAAPVEFSWAANQNVVDAAEVASAEEQQAADRSTRPIDAAPVRIDRRRPALIVLAAIAAIAGVVGVLTVVGGDGDGDGDGDDATSGVDSLAPPTDPVIDSLPPITTDSVIDSRPPITTVTTAAGDDEATVTDGSSESGNLDAPSSEQTTLKVAEGTWSTSSINVPAELGNMQPTTIALLSDTGVLHEVELPSGTVYSIGLDRRFWGGQLVVGATTTMLSGFTSGRPNTVMLHPGAVPIEIELATNRNDVRSIPSTDQYVMYSWDGEENTTSAVHVGEAGLITTDVAEFGSVAPWLRSYSPAGHQLVTDAGGVYEEQADGTVTRISDGVLVSTSSHHLLVRECDEAYACEFVLIDGVTGGQHTVDVDDSLNPQLAGDTIQVSPDGMSARYLSLSPANSTEVLLDLSTGEATEIGTDGVFETGRAVWAAGSEGVFRRAPGGRGLELIDRVTGRATPFAEELGTVVQFGVRLGIALPEPVAPTALATGIELVGLSVAGDIVQIDVDSGAVITTDAPPLASGAPARVFPDADGALIVSYDNVPSIRFDLVDRSAVFAESMRPGGPLPDGPVVGSVWEGRGGTDLGKPVMVLVDALGQPLGPTIDWAERTSLVAGDGAGGVLFDADLDGVFAAVHDASPQRLTTGELLAINADVAFVRECDQELQCGVALVDRRTGDRELVTDGLLDRAAGMPAGVVWSGSSVSPDGDVVIAFTSADGLAVSGAFVADRATGRSVAVPQLELSTPIIWSDDSQFALFLANDAVTIYDRAASQVQMPTELPLLKAIAAVPDNVADIAAPVFVVTPNGAVGVPRGEAADAAEYQELVVGPARFPF